MGLPARDHGESQKSFTLRRFCLARLDHSLQAPTRTLYPRWCANGAVFARVLARETGHLFLGRSPRKLVRPGLDAAFSADGDPGSELAGRTIRKGIRKALRIRSHH